jgi:hypothetical protein
VARQEQRIGEELALLSQTQPVSSVMRGCLAEATKVVGVPMTLQERPGGSRICGRSSQAPEK